MSDRSMLDHFNLLCAVDAVLNDHLTAEAAGRARLALARAVDDYDLVPPLEGPLRAWREAYGRVSGDDRPDYVAALEALRAARAASKEAP